MKPSKPGSWTQGIAVSGRAGGLEIVAVGVRQAIFRPASRGVWSPHQVVVKRGEALTRIAIPLGS